ncbi:uncharacterized protein LOC107481938 [Arachis duranensis]|uniref:Uncharacterized protein LOC107481938 n=1 Tax=Arachis duranensis TaxID=130453 RepID=A0A6P4D1L4_ARADU|nr:uncharacterized protein LOC107481938 [Arachis duranensis]
MSSIEGRVIKLNRPGELGYKKDCLNVVGKIISDNKISFKTCKNALLEMWGNPQEVAVIAIGSKKMLFSFKDRKKGLQIMQNGPWNVRRNMVNLRLWREGESVFEVDHDIMEFWIQIHGIPLDLMEKEIGARIREMLGVLAEAEDPKMDGILRKSYLRIRVSIDITKALPRGFWLDREELPPLWVFFRFNDGGRKLKTTALKREGEEWERAQQNWERESGEKKSSEESRIREEQAIQQKIREESVWKNQTEREEEMAEAEEQVEKVQKIPDFQGIRNTQTTLEAAYKFKSLIKEIMERKNYWANNNKAQKGGNMIEAQREDSGDKEAKKLRNSNASRDSGEYQLATQDSKFRKKGQMAEEAGLNMPQPQP